MMGLAASMAVAFLTAFDACSSPDKIKDNYDDVFYEDLEPVRLNFYAMDYTESASDNKEVENIMKEIEKKLADNIKVKPKFHFIESEKYVEVIKTLITSGKDIDAYTCNGIYQFENYTMDITNMFPIYAPGCYNELISNEAGKELIYYSSIDGKLYSVSCNVSCPRYFIVARKDLVDKYAKGGFETLEDYGEFLKSVTENEPCLIPENQEFFIPRVVSSKSFFDAYMKGNVYYNYDSVMYSTWKSEGKELYLMENTGEFIEAYSMLIDWRKKGYAPKKL